MIDLLYLESEIRIYQDNMSEKMYGELIRTGKQTEMDYEWEENLITYIESIYEQRNKICNIPDYGLHCSNCKMIYEHKMGHFFYGAAVGWKYDHHEDESWEVVCCFNCCGMENCEHAREFE